MCLLQITFLPPSHIGLRSFFYLRKSKRIKSGSCDDCELDNKFRGLDNKLDDLDNKWRKLDNKCTDPDNKSLLTANKIKKRNKSLRFS